MTDYQQPVHNYARPRTSNVTPILAGAALVIAGYVLLDRSGFLEEAPKGEPRPVVARGDLMDFERTSIAIFEANRPSVVHITLQKRVRTMDQNTGTGSGFIWDEQGHIVTNYHVIKGYDKDDGRIVVRFADRNEYTAYVVQADPTRDIAVLRFADRPPALRPLTVGTSHDLRVGQSVFAIGNPFGLDLTFTTGVVSALDRSISTVKHSGVPLHNLIQTDAAINPGNSGGPLFDSAGRLIGMNTAIISKTSSSAGIGFAVPIDIINKIVPSLIERRIPPRAIMGVYLHDRPIRLPVKTAQGHSYAVPITKITPGYGADKAGLLAFRMDSRDQIVEGDAIIALDDKAVESASEAINTLRTYLPGTEVTTTVIRYRPRQEPRIEKVTVRLKGFAEQTTPPPRR